jgi:death-on-curing protein
MIDIKVAIYFHENLIKKFGGSNGIRDRGALEAAINRPFATFDNLDLYPTPIEKAAALFESIVVNHPFIDGNKRTAYVLMKFLLFKNGIIIKTSQVEIYQMVISASMGEIRFDEIKIWLQSKTSKNQ